MAPLPHVSAQHFIMVLLALGFVAAALEGQGGCKEQQGAAVASEATPGTCPAKSKAPTHREDVLLQVSHRHQHELWRANRTRGGGYCCLTDECGRCSHRATGIWCTRGQVSCEYFCRGSWCAPQDALPSTLAPTTSSTSATTTTVASTPTVTTATTSATTTTTTMPSSTQPPTAPPPTPAPSTTPASGEWITGTWTTGYWDCCKPSCSWPNKGKVNRAALACDARTGERLIDPLVKSVCDGGTAAACADNAPFLVKETLSMGFTAVAVSGSHGLVGDTNCGQCYELNFVDRVHPEGNWGGAHRDLAGKSMIVQVTNIGYDVTGDHSFDIQIPAAGQGAFTSGCTSQFPGFKTGDFDCDNHYGGCNEKAGCARLPGVLRKPCEWRYDWYRWLAEDGRTNNPYVNFRRVRCPEALTRISGSVPLDDESYPVVDVESYV